MEFEIRECEGDNGFRLMKVVAIFLLGFTLRMHFMIV